MYPEIFMFKVKKKILLELPQFSLFYLLFFPLIKKKQQQQRGGIYLE